MKKLSIRSMIVAPKGKILVAADLSQAESWCVAYLAQDPNMQYSLNYSDIHSDSASFVVVAPENYCVHDWQEMEGGSKQCKKCELVILKTARYIGKRFNHASAYRMKPPRAAQVINKDSDKPPYVTVTLAESKLYQERWHSRYKVKSNWWPEVEEQMRRDRTITTTYGRRRTFFGNWGEELFREATAYEPQSTIADHFNGKLHPELRIEGGLRSIFYKLVKSFGDRSIINQSHDSFLAEVPKEDGREFLLEAMALLRRPIVIKGTQFTIPVDGEWGERYGELERFS